MSAASWPAYSFSVFLILKTMAMSRFFTLMVTTNNKTTINCGLVGVRDEVLPGLLAISFLGIRLLTALEACCPLLERVLSSVGTHDLVRIAVTVATLLGYWGIRFATTSITARS